MNLVRLGLLTESELESAISIEFNPMRVGFHGSKEEDQIVVNDILNVGVAPDRLIGILKEKFLKLGGCLKEFTEFKNATVAPDGVRFDIGSIFDCALFFFQ